MDVVTCRVKPGINEYSAACQGRVNPAGAAQSLGYVIRTQQLETNSSTSIETVNVRV
jgi:hypothetical protein